MKKLLLNPWVIGAVLLLGGITAYAIYYSNAPGEYDDFAKCLGEKGVLFYGTYWCPFCLEQKRVFGRSAKHLPYVECSLPSKAGVTEVCITAGIKSYPTWEFSDGTRQTGVLGILELSQKTGCAL
ncbi:MAG TPA: hypothetical protein VJB90_04130 [Candidatus Nanoarchaeia archaeon]|nr:hypothetical protein [Candidatus Nanoarchaeia archaeon]